MHFKVAMSRLPKLFSKTKVGNSENRILATHGFPTKLKVIYCKKQKVN